ncbi:phage head closure protein [Anaerobacillus sp. MEB173]|uniref:phage head closure protein n=1 Tax=Anaerobacillus sp. MEB173 TaxID=3383345 RepID=UPI003F8E4EAB
MTFDYELSLINSTNDTNEIGDVVSSETKVDVLCDVLSVTRTEHYSAEASGLKPEIVFIVNKFEYDNQKEVEFEGKKYSVIRAYTPKKSKDIGDFENIELVCQGVINNGTS